MFSADDIKARLRERPFTPVRFVTTSGETYDVDHPDLVFVARRFLIIGVPGAEDPTLAEQVTRVGILHITEMRDLSRPAPPPANGPPTS
jgi:hypothetical protein